MVRLLAFLLPPGLLIALLSSPAAARPVAEPSPIKLVVVVYFDQFRGDYLGRWGDLFGEGGFRRLTTQGAWFTNCHYPYAVTTTGPGHASGLTGCGGAIHGIINNEWYDRLAGKGMYCAASDRYQFVPSPKAANPLADARQDTKTEEDKLPGNPDKLLAETTADRVKAAGGRVFGLSLKDRSAIFPSGHKADGAYWFVGRFVTSTYYRDTLPKWVSDFNASGEAQKWVGKTWDRLRPDLDYTARSGPDDVPSESTGKGGKTRQGRTFPHPFPPKAGDDYYDSVVYSPAGNELLLAFAKTCVEAEKLGTGDRPDLLTVSFSSNDLVGHTWGPDSHEVLDVTLRSDAIMAELLGFLDQKVGAGKYAVLLSADHGVAPLPPVDKRMRPAELILKAERFLQDTYGRPAGGTGDRTIWLEALAPPHVYLNHRLLKARGIDPDDAADKLAAWLPSQPGIQAAYSRRAIESPSDKPDLLRESVRLCYRSDRGGDVLAVPKPYHLFDKDDTGTSHGTPHSYDTHVPLLVYAPGVPGGQRAERVTPLHMAPIASKLLGVDPPKTALYPLPSTLYGK